MVSKYDWVQSRCTCLTLNNDYFRGWNCLRSPTQTPCICSTWSSPPSGLSGCLHTPVRHGQVQVVSLVECNAGAALCVSVGGKEREGGGGGGGGATVRGIIPVAGCGSVQACPILLHDHTRDHVFERLVELGQLLNAVVQARRRPLANLVDIHSQDLYIAIRHVHLRHLHNLRGRGSKESVIPPGLDNTWQLSCLTLCML